MKFTKAGAYTCCSDLRTGMKAWLAVAEKGAAVPTARRRARSRSGRRCIAATGPRRPTPAPTPWTSAWPPRAAWSVRHRPGEARRGQGRDGQSSEMTKGELRPHPATFGPGKMNEASSSAQPHRRPPSRSPSIDPGHLPQRHVGWSCSLSPTTHGNGFLTSSPLDADQQPRPYRVDQRPSTRRRLLYYCLIHPFMVGYHHRADQAAGEAGFDSGRRACSPPSAVCGRSPRDLGVAAAP